MISTDEALAITVSVTAGDAAISSAAVTVSIGRSALGTRDDLAGWLAAPDPALSSTTVGTATVTGLAPGERNTGVVRVAADDPAVADLPAGVYPILAVAQVGGEDLSAASVFVVSGDTSSQIAVIVPVTAPVTGTGLLTADQLSTLTAPDGALTATLSGVQGTAAILAVDPAIPAAIRALGSAAPADALDWLARLEALPNDRFALQFGDADPALEIAAGAPEPLAPTSLAAYLDEANFADVTAPTPTGSPSPTPTESGAPVEDDLPPVTQLMDVGATGPVIFWPARVDAAGVAQLAIDGAWTLIGSDAVTSSTSAARVAADGAQLVVFDAALSAAASTATTSADTMSRSVALAETSALQALPGAHLSVIALERSSDMSASALRAVIDQVTATATALSLEEITALDGADAEVIGTGPTEDEITAAQALLTGEERITPFSTVLDEPVLLTSAERAEILQLMGVGWLSQPDVWAEALSTHAEETAATLAAVAILPPSPIQLVAADAAIPVGIHNDLPYAVTVVLHARTDDLRLDVAESVTLSIGPNQSARAALPVQARVGSGSVDVEIALTSTSGVPIGSPQALEVNVHADWESIGLVVLGVLAALFLGVGVFRTVRRFRRPHSSVSTDTPASSTTDEDEKP
ncbi:hypothetical protein GCM10009808_21320 [Microbacterium sediminicola]|uniref:2-oxoglutarate dehydrogenase n=1 Tax=Microbacterium sediminicola TaxID=415210 RepID=A0ABP4UDJ0_9MICO